MGGPGRAGSFYDVVASPLGSLYLVFSGTALSGVSFHKPSSVPLRKNGAPPGLIKELTSYFQGEDVRFQQKIKLPGGSEFERRVWSTLRKIPHGETRTYKWLAEKVGKPGAARAVGQALGKNPLPIVLPCHRVIESDGSLGGYSSGIKKKIRLLEIEYYGRLNKQGGT